VPNDATPSVLAYRPSARIKRTLVVVAAIIVAIGVIGFLVLPPLARPWLEQRASEALGRKVAIESLRVNPFALSATLSGVSVGERGDGAPLFTTDEVYLNAETISIARWAPVVGALKVTRPTIRLVRNADNTYNISDLIERALAGPPGPPPRFSVSNIEVVDGRIEFDDRPENAKHEITALTLGIPFVSSLPSQTETHVEPKFSALVDGKHVAITGDTRPFLDTHETVLHFDAAGVPLTRYLGYVPLALPITIESGTLDANIDVRFVGRGKDPPLLTVTGTTRLADLALKERSGEPLLRVPSLAIELERVDVLGRKAEVRSIAVDGLELDVRRNARGELNLATAFASNAPSSAPAEPYRFHASSIKVTHGIARLNDVSVTPAFVSTLSDVGVEISNLGTASDQKADVAFSFSSDTGARIEQRGKLSLAPFNAQGRLQMAGLKVGKLFPYYESALNLVVDDGALDASTEFRVDNGALVLSNLDAKTSDLKLRLPDEKDPLWRMPMLAVHGGTVDVAKRTIVFDAVEGRGAVAAVHRGADGNFDFVRLVRASPPGVAPAAGGEGWTVQAKNVALDDFAATIVDETVSPAAHIALSKLALRGENLANSAGAKGRASLEANVNKHGTISLNGPITTTPFSATLDVVAKGVDLVPFQPYLSQSARMIVTQGNVSARGATNIAAGTPMHAGFKGDVTVADLAVLDEANQSDLVKWKTLTLGGVDAQAEPLAVNVGEITLDQFFARLLLNESGEFNLQQLARAKPPATAPPKPTLEPRTVEVASTPGTAKTWLRLGKATLSGGNIDFTDHFIRPNYSANLTDLAGTVSTLAFDQPADVDLRGSVQHSAPVEIAGRVNPLGENLFLDIKASATDIELPPLSPYSGKYVGYGIEKGTLSMKVRYRIDNRKLTAENTVILDQLTFGNKVESADAIKVPVELAVALLKDRNGVIKFDLPVGGSLDDPKFSVGGIVIQAIVNLLTKIVTAPFAVLGALGGHSEELSYIEFEPGSATISADAERKIDAIGKALVDRPALKLDIAGRSEPSTDDAGLKRAALDRKIRVMKFNDLAKSDDPPASVDAVSVSPAEYDALLLRVYKAEDMAKPRNAIGIPKDIPREEMESLLLAHTSVGQDDLRQLAERRAANVQDRLVSVGHVPHERLFLVAARLDAQGIKDSGKPTRVDFALR
jgi:hypothetical protein